MPWFLDLGSACLAGENVQFCTDRTRKRCLTCATTGVINVPPHCPPRRSGQDPGRNPPAGVLFPVLLCESKAHDVTGGIKEMHNLKVRKSVVVSLQIYDWLRLSCEEVRCSVRSRQGDKSMSLGLILVIILIIFLLGGFSGRFGGYGYGHGHGGIGVLGIVLIILVVLLLTGRL